MAPRSKIAKLPAETKAWLDRALSDNNFADYELLAAELKARGFDISKSAVHRYGQEFEMRLSALRMATEQARAISESIPDDAGAMNDALIRLVQQKAFDTLLKMEEGAPMKEIGLMVARLSNATVKQKQWAAEDRAIRVQAVQAINNSGLRHQVFANWVSNALARRAPGHDVQVVGFVSEEIADFAKANNGGVDAARVLTLPEKRLVHADNQKHHAGGIALTPAEYQALPQIVAKPDAVYWDKLHNNLVYVAGDVNGGLIYIPVDAADNVKPHGRLDAIVNAYKLDASNDGAGRLKNVKRYIRME